MIQDRDDVVALDSAIIQHPRTWEASGHLAGFTDPLVDCRTCKQRFRADHLGELECGRRPSKHPGEDAQCDLTESREFNLMFETTIGPGEGGRRDRLPAPRDRAGDLPRLQAGAAVRAPQAAVRDRAGRQVVPQRDHARQLHLPHARVRADGDGVLRPARRGASEWYEHWMRRALRLVRAARHRPRPPAPARARRRRALALLLGDQRRRVPVPDRLVGARGDRQPRRLRPHPARAALGREARVRRPAGRRALRPARDRARRRRRRARCSRSSATPTTRTRSAASSAPCCGCTRRSRRSRSPCCRCCARTATRSSRARSTRSCAATSRPSTTTAARSAGATGARTRSARRSRSRSTTSRSRTARSRCATATRSRRSASPIDGLRAAAAGPARPSEYVFLTWRPTAADQISYEDLYARWERGNWRATEIDFSAATGAQWQEQLLRLERRAALWNYALFFWGEDAVADNLSPFIDAAPREEQKYFLATQQVDEARHAVFFKRFMREVAGLGDGTRRGRAGGDPAAAHLGLRQDVRAARHARRRAAPRPLAHQARAGRDALPRRHRGDARAARASTSSRTT